MKISIIIPCYNVEKYIVQCVKSATKQSYSNIEVICIDNESTDATYDILKKLNKQNNFTLETAKNIYPYCWDEARNKGMDMMTGEWFTVMCSDDYVSSDYISNAADYIQKNPNVLSFQSPMIGIQDGREASAHKHDYGSIDEFKTMCLEKSPVNTPTVFYHRSLYENGLAFGKPEQYSGAADYNLYCEMADAGVFINPLPDHIGYYYRWHEGQATWGMHKSPIKYDLLIREKWKQKWKQI